MGAAGGREEAVPFFSSSCRWVDSNSSDSVRVGETLRGPCFPLISRQRLVDPYKSLTEGPKSRTTGLNRGGPYDRRGTETKGRRFDWLRYDRPLFRGVHKYDDGARVFNIVKGSASGEPTLPPTVK